MSEFVIRGQAFTAPRCEPGLYVTATPIGNLDDITLRAIEVLAGCDLIACEDTRVTAKLLRRYGIDTPTTSYHEHNADAVGPQLIERLEQGEAVALVSDAGTPLISDPGQRLVMDARKAGIGVIPVPGASAPLAALVASGLPSATWTFAGFLPSKQVARQKVLKHCLAARETAIFFESPNRLMRTLADIREIFGADHTICIAREITKLHEEVLTGPVYELEASYSNRQVRGEIVLLVGPLVTEAKPDPESLLRELLESRSVSGAAAEAAQLTGLPKRELYKLALSLKDRK